MPIGFPEEESGGGLGGMIGSQAGFIGMMPFLSARAINRGFSGKGNSVKRMLFDESIGLKPDFIVAKKITGTSLSGRMYSAGLGRLPESVKSFAPTLAHLGPSRQMNMFNLYMGGSPEGMLKGVGKFNISVADMMAGVGRYNDLSGAPLRTGGRFQTMTNTAFRKVLGSELAGEYGWDVLAGGGKMVNLPGELRGAHKFINGSWAAGDAAGIRAGQGIASKALGASEAGADLLTKKLAGKMVGTAAGRVAGRAAAALAVNYIPVAGQVISIAMWASMGLDAAKWGTKAAFRGAMGVGSMVGEDWRRGMFQTSSVSPFVGGTQRQRALQVMQQTGLQLSSALGNEAQYF